MLNRSAQCSVLTIAKVYALMSFFCYNFTLMAFFCYKFIKYCDNVTVELTQLIISICMFNFSFDFFLLTICLLSAFNIPLLYFHTLSNILRSFTPDKTKLIFNHIWVWDNDCCHPSVRFKITSLSKISHHLFTCMKKNNLYYAISFS